MLRFGDSTVYVNGSSFYADTQVRVHKCISDKNCIRNSVSHRANLVVDVGVDSFRGHDWSRACTLARRRVLRRYGAVPRHTCPRRFATPLRVGRNQDEVPSAGFVRPAYSVSPVTAKRKYGSVIVFRTRTFCETAFSIVPTSS